MKIESPYNPPHTQAPWSRNIRPASKYPFIFSGRNTHVAQVISKGLPDSEIEANCNLIVAAPNILYALKRAVCHLRSRVNQSNADLCVIELAEAAISIAEPKNQSEGE